MDADDTPNEAPKLTDPNVLNLKMIAALLEAIDIDDPKDAALAVKTIKGLLVTEWKEAPGK